MNPATKRFKRQYGAAADAISRLNVDQVTRELVAETLTEAFTGQPDFKPELFLHIARDPLCTCAGPDDDFATPCPHGREIRVAMHLRDAPDGRSEAWQSEKPVVRCVSCGAARFIPGYRENAEAYATKED